MAAKADVPPLGVTHAPLRDRVTDELRRMIVEGAYQPGTRLVELELAEHFGVSRVPVREALRRLESEGFVTVLPRRGALVRAMERADLEELFEVREALEVQAIRLATARATPEDLGALEHTILDAERALGRKGRRHLDDANQAFHDVIVEMAHNSLLSSLLEPLQGRLHWMLRQHENPEAYLHEHRGIYEAIAAGQVEEAGRLGLAHVHTSRRLIMGQLFPD